MAYPDTPEDAVTLPDVEPNKDIAKAAHQNTVRAIERALSLRAGSSTRGGSPQGYVSAQIVPALTVRVAAIEAAIFTDPTAPSRFVTGAPFTSPAFAPHATLPRIDLLLINSAGTLSIVTGTAAGTPAPPAWPADGRQPLAYVYLRANATAIYDLDDGVSTHGYILAQLWNWSGPTTLGAALIGARAVTPDKMGFTARAVTATTTALTTDFLIGCDATTGALTVNLPALAGAAGMLLVVKKIDSSANAVTVDPNGAELIDTATGGTATTRVLTVQGEGVIILPNAALSAWREVDPLIAVAGGDLAGNFPNPTVAQVSAALAFKNPISPAALSSQTDNWNPTGLATATCIRAYASVASVDITGLAGGVDGRLVMLENVGASNNLVLKDESTSSTAGNRFALTADITMTPDTFVILKFDATSARWRAVAGGGGGSSLAIQWLGVVQTARAALDFETGFTLVDDSSGNRTKVYGAQGGAPAVLANAQVALTSGNVTTTSTSFVDLTGYTTTLTTHGGAVAILSDLTVSNSGANTTVFDFLKDGVSLSGRTDGFGGIFAAQQITISPQHIDSSPSAASHVYKVQWRVTAGTGTVYANTTDASRFYVQELPTTLTGGAGAGLAYSGAVTRTAGTLTTTSTSFVDATSLTATVATNGGDLVSYAQFGAHVSGAGSDAYFDFAVDGTRVGGTNGSQRFDQQVAGYDYPVSMRWRATALAAGSHATKLQWMVSGGTGTLMATTAQPAYFWAEEAPLLTGSWQATPLGSATQVLTSGNVTTTSTTFVDTTGVAATITTQGGPVLLVNNFEEHYTAANLHIWDYKRGTIALSSGTTTELSNGVQFFTAFGAADTGGTTVLFDTPAAGTYTYQRRWKTSGGTATYYGDGSADKGWLFLYELPTSTGGSGGVTLGTGSVALTTGDVTTTSTSFTDLTGYTTTLNTAGGNVQIASDLTLSNSGANSTMFDFLRDGISLSGRTDGFGGVFASAAKLTISPTHIDPLVTTGSHIYKVQWRVSAGTGTLYADTTDASRFYIQELPVTTGSNYPLTTSANTSVPGGNTVANTPTETTLASNYVVPANRMVPGTVIDLYLAGVYSSSITGGVTLRIKFGTTTLCASGVITPSLSETNAGWTAQIKIICFTNGASGTVEVQGWAAFSTAAATAALAQMQNTATVTVDTTVAQTLQATVQWNETNASDSITLRQFVAQVFS